MKKIIIYQSSICAYGGVETFLYNWCWWLRNYFDVTVLYCNGDATRIGKMKKIVKLEKYDPNKTYECDVFIRNSVWGTIVQHIKAERTIEMRHANYKWLKDKGLLFQQYKDMGIKEIVGCGEYVSKMSTEALGDHPTTIRNILMPKRDTHKILHLISCTRIDKYKGWDRMLKLCQMLRDAKIKFEWKIFTNSPQKCDYEEVHFYNARYDIWDNLVESDYCCLLSDSEGMPYTVQEALQYQVPCIVTNVGGCTELIKDGVNGYVVPLDMSFDVTKLLDIPKCPEYDNHALEDWLKYLGYKGKINKDLKIEEEIEVKVKVKGKAGFDNVLDAERKVNFKEGDIWITDKDRAEYLQEKGAVEIIEEVPEIKDVDKALKRIHESAKEEVKETKKKKTSKKK